VTTEPMRLEAEDAVELGELLGFIGGWLAGDRHGLGVSLRRYVGSEAYDIEELRSDVRRFEFLLGGGDGSAFLGGEPVIRAAHRRCHKKVSQIA
jgi:hypothetical protein